MVCILNRYCLACGLSVALELGQSDLGTAASTNCMGVERYTVHDI